MMVGISLRRVPRASRRRVQDRPSPGRQDPLTRPHPQPVAWTATALLLAVFACGCGMFGPELSVGVDNTEGHRAVTVTVDSSASKRDEGPVTVGRGTGAAWSVPLGSTWEVKVDGRHIIGSIDRPDLVLPPSGRQHDVSVQIQISGDGTVMTVDAR